MDPFHRRLARLAFDTADDLGLMLAGGYAISAHGLTSRPSRDLDFVTRSPRPLPEVTELLATVYRDAGFGTHIIDDAVGLKVGALHDRAALHRWARSWADDIRGRLAVAGADMDREGHVDWDEYLDD